MSIKTVSITNQKGGVGKTTTAVNLAAALQIAWEKVLLVDMDHQGDSGKALGYKIDELDLTITDVLIDKISVPKVMVETRMPGLFILPANQDLSAASLAMAGMTGREFLLQKSLSMVRDQFDYIIIDCPPQLGLLTVNSFVASDALLLCCQMSNLALEGVMDLIKSYNMLKENMDYSPIVQELSILGIVSTFYDARNSTINTCLVKKITEYAIENNKGIVFENLKFKKDFENQGRKFNRIKSNFVWKKLLTLLERKCIENGIMYKKVNPAFTSIIGKFKYQKMYNLSIHKSASYVVGRRGLGFNEKLSLYKYPKETMKNVVLDLAGDRAKRIHSWVLWRKLRDNYKAVLTGLQSGMSNIKELDGNLCYAGENPAGKVLFQELVKRGINV